MTTIRAFDDADAPAVAALIHRCLREVNSRDYPPEIIERMCSHFTEQRIRELATQRHMFVAELQSPVGRSPGAPAPTAARPGLAGSAAVGVAEAAGIAGTVSRDGNKVYTMFVHPDAAGRGIGRLLMRHIEALAALDGYDHMETGASITAHDFYHRLGYVDVRTSETDFGFNYILRRPLP